MLVLVVGPSGAGKDTLIAAASQTLGESGRFRFVRRVVTRPAADDDEPHEPVTEDEFTRRAGAGAFALEWRAHGLRYGIPASIAADLATGCIVICNISRAVVADAAQRFPVHVIEITAPPAVLAQRLAARAREDAADIARRLSRGIALAVPVPRDTIENAGSVEEGTARFLAVLNRLAQTPPA